MKLDQFIEEQLMAMEKYEIDEANFDVSLDGEGLVVAMSSTTVRFKLNLNEKNNR